MLENKSLEIIWRMVAWQPRGVLRNPLTSHHKLKCFMITSASIQSQKKISATFFERFRFNYNFYFIVKHF